MRHSIIMTLSAAVFGLSACTPPDPEAEVERALQDLNVVDESNLNDVMLTVGDPNEAVSYFASANANDPGRIDLQRGLAKSLVRAKRAPEAIDAWKTVVAHGEATNADSVDLADAYIRNNDWDEAAATLNTVPPTYETFKRYRLEAMVADSRQQWEKADSFYEIAVGLTTRPASVYNNWAIPNSHAVTIRVQNVTSSMHCGSTMICSPQKTIWFWPVVHGENTPCPLSR